MKTIKEFCKKHNACDEGRRWAIENCKDMQEAWNTAKPEWVIWIAIREGVLTNKELRLFAVFCVRQVQHLMEDERSINAIDVAERHAYGNATDEELAAARAAASDAAARAAAIDVAWAAASEAAWAAAKADSARDAQIEWLRDNCEPCFD